MLMQERQRLAERRARAVIDANPWATLVTHGPGGLIASHMPALVDPDAPQDGSLVILTHTARADPQTARVEAGHDVLVVFQGENGYLPGDWEGGPGASTGTWDFEAVHVGGRPELLDRTGSLRLLRRTFEHLESRRARPHAWNDIAPIAEEIVGGTCCFCLPVQRLDAKAKLGQDKPVEVRERLIARLEEPGPYRQPGLAARIRETLPGDRAARG
jgi:transcriptional regulator